MNYGLFRNDGSASSELVPLVYRRRTELASQLYGNLCGHAFGQLNVERQQYLTDKKVVTDQASKVHGVLNAEPVLYRIESRVADFAIADEFLGVPHKNLFVSGESLRSGALGNCRNGFLGYSRCPGQFGVGGEFVLGRNPLCGGNDYQLLQSFRYIEVEANEGSGVGDPGCQLRAVEQNTIRSPDATPAADYLIEIFLVLGFEFLSADIGQS